uniref:succinate dehydrogenase n=1 Tax=Rhodosorus marinus TaxID=101924 RepID=A0A7S3EG69_9RHOD|mmetsp:Transcript_33450/g.131965  ORF Transcript_33450/g.131965 Transcript_33450/m.131965 type:complete len:227 (+) Transcript_33450:399-1079(+)
MLLSRAILLRERAVLVRLEYPRSTADTSLLSEILNLRDHVDPSLSMRYSCREGVCGSCALTVGGQTTLACTYFSKSTPAMASYGRVQAISVGALVRDLVWSLSMPNAEYSVAGASERGQLNVAMGRQAVGPSSRALLEGHIECVLCYSCSMSCPSKWWHRSSYLGPAILLNQLKWRLSKKHQESSESEAMLLSSTENCHTILNCVRTCPKKLNPAAAIEVLRTIES